MKKKFVGILLLFTVLLQAEESIILSKRNMCDLELLLNGGFAPLSGFMNHRDYDCVVENMRLANGKLWPMPIVLDVSEDQASGLQLGQTVDLKDEEGFTLAHLYVEDIWKPDKDKEAELVYGTKNTDHVGVDYIKNQMKEWYVGGTVKTVTPIHHIDFSELRKTPEELKAFFKENGINKVVAFQTRNPMHRAHVELTKRAAQQNDAHLLIHPAVGLTKPGDVDYFTRVHAYKRLLKYYPEEMVTLSLLPISMRMAGPREALWHALIRKNYGVTHFIIGRDHAGPGPDRNGNDFYGPYDAQNMVAQYADEIGITMVPFKMMVYIKETDEYVPIDEVPEGATVMTISGTQLRALLKNGEDIPTWFTYPEVAEELRKVYPPKNKQGVAIFLTGLSGSGKSTLVKALALKLSELQDRKITLLDGDVIRYHLSSELGFSKEHRSINVRRVGYVASEIVKHGGISLCALIAPYESDRKFNRDLISSTGNYIEVYIATPLSVCEERDVKGLYAKAREGLIPEFTGVSDPYENPSNPELVIDTSKSTIEESIIIILNYLKDKNLM